MTYTQESLYQLRPNEFEELCAKVIKDILPGITDIEHLDNVSDISGDIIGKIGNETVAIEVKHKLKITRQDVQSIFAKLVMSANNPKHVVLMTSASIHDIDRSALPVFEDVTYYFIGVDDILKVLNKPEIKKTELNHALKRSKQQGIRLFIASLAMIISFGASMITVFLPHEKQPLERKIESVEIVIGNLKDLEGQLKDIKDDMLKTQKAKILIEQEYKEAKELEKITAEQLELVKRAIKSQSWQDTLLQYFLAFVLGAASSIVGSIIISKIKQRQALKD